jgi:glutamate racemase
MKIGVFDSGVGGIAIAKELEVFFPKATILIINDARHVPYGNKSQAEVICLTDIAIKPLLKERCDIIVIACNTATALAIDYLREHYPQQKFIGIEPMVKAASTQTKSKIVAVCATPATLQSKSYQRLKTIFAQNITVIEPDCSRWALMIQDNTLSEDQIHNAIEPCLKKGADVIVLGCTHYHWIKDYIESITKDRAIVLEPSRAIAQRIRQLL